MKGLELSPVVLLDFMQLYPSRSVTVVRSSGSVFVSASGRSYTAATKDGKAYFTLTLETRRQELPAGDDAVGWTTVPGRASSVMTGKTSLNGITTWTGSLDVPAGSRTRYRVVLREFEVFEENKGTRARPVFSEAIEL